MTQPRMQIKYREKVVPAMQAKFNYANPMQMPRLSKIVLNVSMKEAITDVKVLEAASEELGIITGQKAVMRRARKAIANFKLREGMPIGTSVTLRRTRMWEFLDRFVSVAVPRVRDFRGLKRDAFDGAGNYSIGITEQIIFPEIEYDKVSRMHGMNITFVTTATNDDEGRYLLEQLGMPLIGTSPSA